MIVTVNVGLKTWNVIETINSCILLRNTRYFGLIEPKTIFFIFLLCGESLKKQYKISESTK